MFYAHTPTEDGGGHWHGLAEHLKGVAARAQSFANPFGGGVLAHWLGLAHDIGKYSDEFQSYLQRCHRAQIDGEEQRGRGPDHSSAGAWLALHMWKGTLVSAIVAGHHGGLPSRERLSSRLDDQDVKHMAKSVAKGLADVPEIDEVSGLGLPSVLQSGTNLQQEMFYRFLFSTLVDADYLDTEAHFDAQRAEARTYAIQDIPTLNQTFLSKYEGKFGRQRVTEPRSLNDIRHVVFNRCLKAAHGDPGMFRLTVPTGGGKTLASLAFALEHAATHDLARVIVAIPFTSIIEQTADTYRKFLGEDAVLEHHSLVDNGDGDGSDIHAVRMRLASENWDMPIVVTTTVQLFDSLFSNRPRSCRKLHRLAQSVLVLDEVQSLPGHYLASILDVLQELVTSYGTSVVLCTATQPEYTNTDVPMRLQAQEIVPEYKEHFRLLRRVDYSWSPGEWSWSEVADVVEEEDQILVILNSRKDAQRLLDELAERDAADVYHLSANLCPLHRQVVLKEIRQRLKDKDPVRLIATQVVEAGVDIDFPTVMRALGPLPSLVQAAGRCNREGGEQKGTVVIFDPAEGHLPPAEYETATATALQLLEQGKDLHDPDVFRTYFRKLYPAIDQDSQNIQQLRERFDYPKVAERFRLIADESQPVVVRYRLPSEVDISEDDWAIEQLLHQARWAGLSRKLMRRLNGYMVNLRRHEFEAAERRGQINEYVPGLYVWYGEYDSLQGLMGKGLDMGSVFA